MLASVAQQSICDIISLNCAPAAIWFGHHMMPGTRQPPSKGEPFSPRNGVVPASGKASSHAPLSAVTITIVFGAPPPMASTTLPLSPPTPLHASHHAPRHDPPP